MDEQSSGPAVDSSVSESTAPLEAMNTTGPQPAGDTQAETQPQTPTPGNPEPTGPAPDTTDPGTPDHGIDPDKGIDPDAGDLPTNPDPPLDNKDDGPIDLKSMSRAERAAYFKEQADVSRRQVEQAIDKAYQPQNINELRAAYIEAGYDEGTATLLARGDVQDQRNQINEARAEIAELNAGMAMEAMEVVNSIPWLNSDNKDSYDQKTTEAVSTLYESLALTKDPNTGQTVEAKLSPKQFYTLMNQVRESGAAEARLEGQKAAERQMAAVAPPSSNTTKRATPFDNLSTADMRAQLLAKGINVT